MGADPFTPGPGQTRTRMMMRRRPLWRRMFLDNPWLKISSAVIAVALFLLVREDKGKEVEIEVPIVLSNISEKDVFVGEMPRAIRVRVRDRWSRLARALERKANPYLVDLRGFADETVFVFDRDRVRQLIGVGMTSIQSVYPSEFIVRVEPKIDRLVPVRPTFVGEVQDGYDIPRELMKISPAEVHIWGARSSVKEVTELATHPIDLSALDRDARIEVGIQKPNLPYLFLEDERVTADMRVTVRKAKIVLEAPVEIAIKGCPEDLICKIEPAAATVTLAGPKPTLMKIKAHALPLEISVDAGDYPLTVPRHEGVRPACERPAGVECVLQPKAVTLTIVSPDQDQNVKKVPQKGK